LRSILVNLERSLGGRQRERLGLWKRNVEKRRKFVYGWAGETWRYRSVGVGSSRFVVRCRRNCGRGSNFSVELLEA
jgi:hypothetical protein